MSRAVANPPRRVEMGPIEAILYRTPEGKEKVITFPKGTPVYARGDGRAETFDPSRREIPEGSYVVKVLYQQLPGHGDCDPECRVNGHRYFHTFKHRLPIVSRNGKIQF